MALLKPPETPHKRWKRPETRAAIIRMINATYALNDWGGGERAANEQSLGLEVKPLAAYSDAELQTILDDFEVNRMILFEKEKNESEN